ncbi:uncharacterized protein MELLADRAFT_95018 [Melampsora larici-populina 98AG31]|uniref:Uncharacterized protein n=1 Tax=Melampsora larici-populina (strain 98AG31 / pathotype 3-4-7) TaxID=747676 RepID=F4S8U3_MELLP|nr:uncharacterized protein MELLADRAFT_95018 [Melampsora larici-populina 98AG31]EGF98961.1 hypothetical protein MELLADRAFT_95018 [Melampsora larici-populina 98AG31]
MLMAALMGGVPEAVVWHLVGEGAKKGHANPWILFLAFCLLPLEEKLPAPGDKAGWTHHNQEVSKMWKNLSKDEKDVFRDPYFFALANLPDLSNVPGGDDDLPDTDDGDKTPLQHLDQTTNAPQLHVCHGKPAPSTSVATIQKKSFVELRKAHHAFAVICQQYQVTYYLAAVSCGSTEGWTQVFSNNSNFAKWAHDDVKVPQTLSSYIHGQSAAKIVKGPSKPQQPSDERKSRLGKQLNGLVDVIFRGHKFPKCGFPEEEMKERGLSVRLVQKEGSLLSKEELDAGHHRAKGPTIKSWLEDIKNGVFLVERVERTSESGMNKESVPKQQTRKISKQTQSSTQISNATQPQPSTSGTQTTLEPGQGNSQLKRKLQELAKGDPHSQPLKRIKKSKNKNKRRQHADESDTAEESDTSDESDSSTPKGSDTDDNDIDHSDSDLCNWELIKDAFAMTYQVVLFT